MHEISEILRNFRDNNNTPVVNVSEIEFEESIKLSITHDDCPALAQKVKVSGKQPLITVEPNPSEV